MKQIRNGIELSNEELIFLKTLPKEKLIEIIEINISNIQIMRELLSIL